MGIARYGRFAVGSGASTACSFACSLILIRSLDPIGFGAFNLIFTLATMAAMASSGADLAYSRMLSQPGSQHERLLRSYVRFKLLTVGIALALASVMLLLTDLPQTAPRFAALIALITFGAGVAGIGFALASAQALGAVGRYAGVQLVPYLALLLGLVMLNSSDVLTTANALLLLAACGLPGFAWFARSAWRSRAARAGQPRSGFKALAVALTMSTALTAAFERSDVLLVSRLMSADDLGIYSAGVRVAGGAAVLSSAFVAFILPATGRALGPRDLPAIYRSLVGPLAAILAACLGAAVILASSLPRLLGEDYERAGPVAAVYVLQYPLVAAYMPTVLAMMNFGRGRWQAELAGLLLLVKIAVILILPRELMYAASGSLIAHACAILYLVWRMRQPRFSDRTVTA